MSSLDTKFLEDIRDDLRFFRGVLQWALIGVALSVPASAAIIYGIHLCTPEISPNVTIHPIGDGQAIPPATTEPPTGAIGCSAFPEVE